MRPILWDTQIRTAAGIPRGRRILLIDDVLTPVAKEALPAVSLPLLGPTSPPGALAWLVFGLLLINVLRNILSAVRSYLLARPSLRSGPRYETNWDQMPSYIAAIEGA